MNGGSALRILGSAQDDLDRALLDEWVIWQRARNVSDKTILERILVIRRLPAAATVTAVEVDRLDLLTFPWVIFGRGARVRVRRG